MLTFLFIISFFAFVVVLAINFPKIEKSKRMIVPGLIMVMLFSTSFISMIIKNEHISNLIEIIIAILCFIVSIYLCIKWGKKNDR